MNYAAIKKNDVANGPGVRVNLFVSGCRHFCKGCFNAEAWDFNYGEAFTDAHLNELLEAMNHSYIQGFTFLGGEPLDPLNRSEVLKIAKAIHERFPDKTIWCYTGYLLDDLLIWAGLPQPQELKLFPTNNSEKYLYDTFLQPIVATEKADDAADIIEFLSLIDVLVDGEFIESRKNLRLQFCGSENQRLINIKETLRL